MVPRDWNKYGSIAIYIGYWQYEAADNEYDISYWVVVVYIGSY